MRIAKKYDIPEIINALRQLGVFTVKEASKVTGLKDVELKIVLSWLKRKGYLGKIEKGIYYVQPYFSLDTGNIEYVIASRLVEPSAVAYWTALSFHEFTEQIPKVVYIQTTARKKKREIEIHGVKYRIVRIKSDRFFGFEHKWVDTSLGRLKITVTDKEKTIVDCLDRPKYCGGIFEVFKAIRSRGYDICKLREYAIRFGKSSVIRRLGYLCELLDIEIDLPSVRTRNYILLDPTLPKRGKVISKWRIIDNIGVTYDL